VAQRREGWAWDAEEPARQLSLLRLDRSGPIWELLGAVRSRNCSTLGMASGCLSPGSVEACRLLLAAAANSAVSGAASLLRDLVLAVAARSAELSSLSQYRPSCLSWPAAQRDRLLALGRAN